MFFGFAPYCPFLDFQIALAGDARFGKKIFQDVSLEFVSACDAMIMLPGWEESRGARREKELAEKMHIPVFTNWNDFIKWDSIK